MPSLQQSSSAAIDTDRLKNLFYTQREHFQNVVRHSTARERIKKLKSVRKWVLSHREEIKAAIEQDFRKPDAEVDLSEVLTLSNEVKHLISHLPEWMEAKKVPTPITYLGTRSEVRIEGKGVCLILAPWNYPFMLAIGPMLSAIAAGCTVVLKPSEMTPATSALMKGMIAELFEEKEVVLLEGDHILAGELLKLPFNHIFFTGSPQVGKIVMRAAAENLSSVTLELGGKNPVVVDESASINDTAEKLIWGKFFNVGQSCAAPDYAMVHSTLETKLATALRAHFNKQYQKDPEAMKASRDFGRVINQRHFLRLKEQIEDAIARGAEVLVGAVFDESENYIAPTILRHVPDDALIMQDEIFGPVLVLQTYDSLDEVISKINERPIPLNLYVFSKSRKSTEKVLHNTQSGSCVVNDTTIQFNHPELPFGGANYSGIGKAHGYYGFMAFSNERAVLRQRRGKTAAKFFYPPYTPRLKKMLNMVVKYF